MTAPTYAQLRAQLDDERRRRTRGGTPPPCAAEWANLASTPPPASAADDTLALGRYTGSTFANRETSSEDSQP